MSQGNQKYTEIPKGIKLSKDLKEFREYCLLKISNPSEFETCFQGFCKSVALTQADKLKLAAERI